MADDALRSFDHLRKRRCQRLGCRRELFIFASQKNEVSAAPCCEGETEHMPSGGVAETLLHETAGRESRLWRFDRSGCRCELELSCLWGT